MVDTNPKIHDYQLSDHNGHVWLTLQVHSARPTHTGGLPHVVEGRPIEGVVRVQLQEHKKLDSVSISLVGAIQTSKDVHFTFADVSQELWSSRTAHTFDLQGDFSWSFSLKLPETVELEVHGGKKSFSLPASLHASWGESDIVYRLKAHTRHHTLLGSDHTLTANVIYVPISRPPAPSPLRQAAYESNAPIPGPSDDPDGWHVLPPVTITGKSPSHNSPIEGIYTLALAKPLSYGPGTVIPLHLTISSPTDDTLDSWAAPTAPVVRLRRLMSNNYDVKRATSRLPGVPLEERLSELKPLVDEEHYKIINFVNVAKWWPTASNDPSIRTLQGEIHLPALLRPSTHLGLFNYFYDVALFPPNVEGFHAHENKGEGLPTVRVEITTLPAQGPMPIAYSEITFGEKLDTAESG